MHCLSFYTDLKSKDRHREDQIIREGFHEKVRIDGIVMKNSRGELKGKIEFGNIREMKERILGDNKRRARLKNQIFLISFGSNFFQLYNLSVSEF